MSSEKVERKESKVVMADKAPAMNMCHGIQVYNRTEKALYVRVYRNVTGSLTVEIRTQP